MARMFFAPLLLGLCLITGGGVGSALACGSCPRSPDASAPAPDDRVVTPSAKPLELVCGTCPRSPDLPTPAPKGFILEAPKSKPLELACGTCGLTDSKGTQCTGGSCN